MDDFWFYLKLGLNHVLDPSAYDHMLFLCALAVPFTINQWKQVALLATLFTVAHCTSLALSAYGIFEVATGLIEFLIPITIFLTALFNKLAIKVSTLSLGLYMQSLTTTFFGLIHGFGFSNYFNMILSQETDKFKPLLSFATGLEIAQILIILVVLLISFIMLSVLKIRKDYYVITASAIIGLITIPMLIRTFPY